MLLALIRGTKNLIRPFTIHKKVPQKFRNYSASAVSDAGAVRLGDV
jgi:hypothetical protein